MATAEETLKGKDGKIVSVHPDTVIFDAVKEMVKNKIGAVVIEENGEYLGIWTERDLLRDMLIEGFDPKTAKIKDYMVKKLISAKHSDTTYMLEDKLIGMRLRHLLVEKNGKYIGILSARDVIRAALVEKDVELKHLNKMCSWEYYEDWKWKISNRKNSKGKKNK